MIRIIEKDGSTKDYDQKDIYALQALRHTGSHVMANAIKRLYPNAKLAIGPFIDNGFYYDIDFGDYKLSDEDFPKIEDEMKKIIILSSLIVIRPCLVSSRTARNVATLSERSVTPS